MGPKKLPMVADPNFLYKELFDANKSLRDMSEQLGDDVGEERLATYRALKGVTGLGDPIHPRNQERRVKGILKHVFGNSPKVGVVQRRLLGSAVDLVGRSVITPNPDLDMDHVGIPESKAWEIYKPFIVRGLVRGGMSRLQAARAVEEKSKGAREALVKEMDRRPVIINRAPTLHRYGVMASWPKLVKGDTLQVSPLVVGGFNADFDGDAMNYHVPSTDEAAEEAAEKMLPSRNLLSAASFGVHYKPSQEYVGGLYEASARQDDRNQPAVFDTPGDAIRAYNQGRINVDRRVVILNP
jgi:DNA-directed RNA polymerase subunit beta'